MDHQTRASLVSWMDGFTRRFGLAPGTPRRAASYVDRVMSARTLSTTPLSDYELGLLGAAAVFAAAKYEDGSTVSKLNAAGIASYCGFATSKEVIRAEREMLAALRYELGGPTSCYTVTPDNEGEPQDLEIQKLAPQAQLAEDSQVGTSLFDDGFLLQLMPSDVAASAVFFAICVIFALFSECISMENLVFQL
jgi:cyclin A